MITASSPCGRRVALAAVLTLLIAIVLAAILLLPDRSLAQAGEPDQAERNSSPAGPVPPPPLNPPIQTPEPGQAMAAPAIGKVDADVEAIRFQPRVRLERGKPVVLPQGADKSSANDRANGERALAGPDRGPQAVYASPDYEQMLSPMEWVPLAYEGFEGAFPTAGWTLEDFGNDGYDRTWGDTNFGYYAGSWSAWPAAGGADALNPWVDLWYSDNLNSWMEYGPLDLSNMADVFVSFGLYYDTEPDWDWVYFCASTDFVNYNCDYWSGYSEGWTDQAYWLTSYAGYSQVWLAWVFISDGSFSEGYYGPYVDEIWVWGDDIGTPTPEPTPDPTGQLIQNGSFETGDLTYWQAYSSAANPIQNGDFENGPDGSWTEYSFQGWPLIVDVFPGSVAPHSGSWAAWLGGADDEISAIQQSVTVPSGSPVLSFWYWIASADACGYDFGGVIVDGTVVDAFYLCADVNTNGWVRRSVDLSAYGGQTVQLDIRAETDSSLNSNLFVDDVTFGSPLLTSSERAAAASPPASMGEAGNPAGGKSASGLLRNADGESAGVPEVLLGPGRDEPKQIQDADAPSPETPRDPAREGSRSPLRGVTGAEEPLDISSVGVTDATAVEGLYSAYLWRNGAGEDFLYQTFAVPADVTDVVLNFWFAVTTDETGVGRDFFCGSLRPAADLNTIWVDMGCIDSTVASDYWQEVLYALTPDEVDQIKGQTAVLIFELYNTGAAGTGTAGWVDYVQVYATGGGAGGALDPNEPNDDPSSATTINCGDTIDTGVIGDALGGYDVDWFRLSNVPTGRVDVDIDADTQVPPSALDSVVGLWDNNLNLVDWNDDDGVSYDSYIVYTNTVNNATFYISVEHYWVYGSPDSFYDLTVQCADSGAGLPPPPPEESPEENTWTVMLYLNAEDSNFEGILTQYRRDIEGFIGSKSHFLNVVILYDGPGTSGTTRYLVQPNGNYTTGTNRWNMGELNMGHPDTLANFATWAMDQYPAENYYLAIDDHGDGAYGISWDPSSNNDQLTPPELYSALKSATRNGARKIDIFDYEACLMGLAENAYDLREWVDYVVFFEQISWGIDTYPQYFRDLADTDTPLQVGRRIIDRYYAEASGANNGRGYPHTISLIDTSQMAAVRDAVSGFGDTLKTPDTNDRKDAVKAARGSSQAFAADIDATNPVRADYIDLWDFANEASASGLAPWWAAAVKSAVDAAVVHERHASGMVSGYTWDHSGAHGLSIYYPHSQTSSAFSGYGSLYQMSRDGTWDEFLAWAVPVGRGRGMSIHRTEIKLTDGEDTFTFKDVYLPMVLK